MVWHTPVIREGQRRKTRGIGIGIFNKIKRGDKLLFAGHMWTVITADMMLVDDLLGVGPYNYYSVEDIKYEESDIKAFIEGWFAAHRDNLVYVASSSIIK